MATRRPRITKIGFVNTDARGMTYIENWHFDCNGLDPSIGADGICGWSVDELRAIADDTLRLAVMTPEEV